MGGVESTDSDDEDEWGGILEENGAEAAEAEQLPDDEEYVDEDKYTTVTVEAMGDGGSDEEEAFGDEEGCWDG